MKHVWKCDFCTKTDLKSDVVKEHEEKCSFNPINKACWSCEFHSAKYEYYSCDMELDYFDYEQDGNCPCWYPDDMNELRKIKLQKLKEL